MNSPKAWGASWGDPASPASTPGRWWKKQVPTVEHAWAHWSVHPSSATALLIPLLQLGQTEGVSGPRPPAESTCCTRGFLSFSPVSQLQHDTTSPPLSRSSSIFLFFCFLLSWKERDARFGHLLIHTRFSSYTVKHLKLLLFCEKNAHLKNRKIGH